jgi:hypothetical protein
VPILVGFHHFLQDLLDVFISGFNNAIHLWTIWGRVMMLNLEVLAQLFHYFVVQICPIICDEPTWNSIAANDLLF